MKTYFNKNSRYFADQWTLSGEAIGSDKGQPTLKLRTSHSKDRKAFTATVSYVEIAQGDGYAMEQWQSDWPMFRVTTQATARYSEKALQAFRDEAIKTLFGQDTIPAVAALLARIEESEVAA